MDYEQARFNMIEQQIRPWEVLDQRVLNLLFQVRREDFVPEPYRQIAFVDMEIPLGHGEVMWAPKLEARVLQELGLRGDERVLEIGTGSGYFTALLAHLAGEVLSVEFHPDLAQGAEARLKAHGIANFSVAVGDGARGWDAGTPFDVIVLTGSTPLLPDAFQKSLKPGGRLFAIVGEAPVMEARLTTCVAEDVCRSRNLFETVTKPLVNALVPERFVF